MLLALAVAASSRYHQRRDCRWSYRITPRLIASDNTNTNTRAQLRARVNFMRDKLAAVASSSTTSTGRSTSSTSRKEKLSNVLGFQPGSGGQPGLLPKFTFELNFATSITNFIFDPDYAKNGTFYTLHMEDPATDAPAAPKAGIVAGLDLTTTARRRHADAHCRWTDRARSQC